MSIHLNTLKKGDLGEATIIVGDPGRVTLISEGLQDVKTIVNNREFLLMNGYYKERQVSICSTGIGVGSTEICVSELIENEVKKIVRCGGCGAWQDGIEAGDIIVNTGMARTSGLMRTYVPDTYPALADAQLATRIIQTLKRGDKRVFVGMGLTSETYYQGQGRTTTIPNALQVNNMMEEWSKLGVMNCEMETAVLYILGSLYQIPVANCLAVHVSRKKNKWEKDEDYRKLHFQMAISVFDAMLE